MSLCGHSVIRSKMRKATIASVIPLRYFFHPFMDGDCAMASANLHRVGVIVLCIGLFGCERQVSFADDVQPILITSCVHCHDQSAEGIAASGFSLVDYDGVMKGTKFGPVVIPNSSISSTLYMVIANMTSPEIHMPPHHETSLAEGRGAPLTEDQIGIIGTWIDQGAQNN